MTPEDTPHSSQPAPNHAPAPIPVGGSRSLAIALVVSAVFLIAAAGVVVWLLVTHTQPAPTVQNMPTDDAKDVKNVNLLPPADLPATYGKTDQSGVGVVHVYYYDTNTACGFTTSVVPVPTDTTVKEAAVTAITSAQAEGFTTTATASGEPASLNDADTGKPYTFESLTLDQNVNVSGVAFKQQHSSVWYKQFGNQVAVLSFACKADIWADKKAELTALAQKFMVKTER